MVGCITTLILALLALALPSPAQAQCPVCTVAVAAGVGMSRYLGIDDTVSGVWMGALTLITGLWVVRWMDKKNLKFMFRRPIIVIAMFVLTVWPLQSMGMIGSPLNTLWGVDKLLLGMLTGAGVFLIAALVDQMLRLQNHDKVIMPFQKVIVPVAMLAVASIVFHLLT